MLDIDLGRILQQLLCYMAARANPTNAVRYRLRVDPRSRDEIGGGLDIAFSRYRHQQGTLHQYGHRRQVIDDV